MPLYLTYQGFNYVDPYNGAYADADSLPQVAKTGATSVAFTPDFGIDVANSSVYAAGDATDSVANLLAAVGQARAQGLTAFVRPLIDFFYTQESRSLPGTYYVGGYDDARNVPSGVTPAALPADAPTISFRGMLQPADLDIPAFFKSYGAMIVQEARAAQAAGAGLFAIGTELDSLATSTDPTIKAAWRDLIAEVRSVYSGKLTYCANWAGAEQVTFWDQLDVVSIDGYVPLTSAVTQSGAKTPSLADLVKGWTTPSGVEIDGTTVGALFGGLSAVDFYNTLAQRSIDKQLVFSELGYPNDTGAARDPAGNAETGRADPALQSRLYAAFFQAWGEAQQTAAANGGFVHGIPFALAGAYFWNWYPDTATPSPDLFSLSGKPALGAIRSAFAPPSTVSVATFLQAPEAIAHLRGGFAIVDTAAAVSAHLDMLETAAASGALTSIRLTDHGLPTLSITYAQAKTDLAALKTITSPHLVAVEPTLWINVATPVLSGTAESDATVALYEGAKLLGVTMAGSDGVYEIPIASLADGTHRLSVRVTDASGQAGVPGLSRTVVIDTRAPLAPGVPSLSSRSDTGRSSVDGVTAYATPTLTGKAEAGALVTLYDSDGVTSLGSALAASNGAYAITAAPLADGTHVLRVRATDKAGNVGALSGGRTIVVDTQAPAAPAAPTLSPASDTGASSADGITRDTTPTLTGFAEAGATVTLYEGARRIGSTTAGADGAYAVTALALAAGFHTLSVTATDKAGNVGPASPGQTLTIDTQAPARPAAPVLAAGSDSGASASDGITQVTTPTLTGTVEAGARVTLYDGTRAIGTTLADAATGAYALTTPVLAAGTHRLAVRATDAAGNVGALSAARTVIVDTRAPSTSITSAGGPVTQGSRTIAGRGEAGTTVTLSDNGAATGQPVVVKANGTWSAAISFADPGTHSIVATGTDRAGNAGTSAAVAYDYEPAGMASLHAMVQAMATTNASASSDPTPTSPPPANDHTLAAAHTG